MADLHNYYSCFYASTPKTKQNKNLIDFLQRWAWDLSTHLTSDASLTISWTLQESRQDHFTSLALHLLRRGVRKILKWNVNTTGLKVCLCHVIRFKGANTCRQNQTAVHCENSSNWRGVFLSKSFAVRESTLSTTALAATPLAFAHALLCTISTGTLMGAGRRPELNR